MRDNVPLVNEYVNGYLW